jgi:chromosome transmission fidelity protein 4
VSYCCAVSSDAGADGYSDLLVKIVDLNDRTKVQSLSDNPKSVRSAAWDPSGQYLVSCLEKPVRESMQLTRQVTAGCDGKVKIYDMTGTAPLHLKIMDGIISPSESE